MADHAREEHKEIRRLLDEVDGRDPADEAVFATFTEILTNVVAHVAEEEAAMFPKLRASLSAEELEQLGKRSEQAEKVAPTHPTPRRRRGPLTPAGVSPARPA